MFGEPFWFFAEYGEYERRLSAVMISCAMLGMGASLSLRDFANVFVLWRGFAIGMAVQILAVPVYAAGFLWLLHQVPEDYSDVAAADMTGVALGIALMAAMPGGSTSNLFTFLGRGNVALSVALTAITTFVCLVTTPIVIELLIAFQIPGELEIDALGIVLDIAIYLIVPVVTGMVIGARMKERRQRFTSVMVRISLVLLGVIVIGSLGAGRLDLPRYGLLGLAAVTLFCLVMQQLAVLVTRATRLDGRDALTVVIEVTVKNVLLALLLLTSMFPHAAFATGDAAHRAVIEAARNGCTYAVLLYGGISLMAGAVSIVVRRTALARRG